MLSVKEEIDAKKQPYGEVVTKIIDKEGFVRKKTSKNMDSLLANFWRFVQLGFVGSLTGFQTVGGGTLEEFGNSFYTVMGGEGETIGLTVGTGTTAVAIDDHNLASRISHGNSAGQLYHLTNNASVQDSGRKVTISRIFENNSGGSINVNEVGLTAGTSTNSPDSDSFMIIRDVLGSTDTVAGGEAIVIEYQFGFNVGNQNIRMFTEWFTGRDFNIMEIDGSTGFNEGRYTNTTWRSGSGRDNQGVIVGTDGTAPAIDDWDLVSRINQGTNAGQLQYGSASVSLNIDTGNNKATLTFSCLISNNSGADIMLKEVGLALGRDGTYDSYTFMIYRGVFGSPPIIVDGTGRTVKIIFEYTV